ncbi:Lreu_0056 family protein [Limosilactobacillus allomucosae]|uniref:Lreu-0056-like domain-containing protein n=2 Tax=Limosilactobacillus TaxID=2742598 RepID=A0ABV0I6Y4_9LACO
MKKSIIMISALMSCFLLTACGNQSSSSSKESSSTAAQSSTAKSSSKKSSQSDIQIKKASSSSDSSATTSSTAKTAKVDDKTTGVMLALLVEPDWFKEYIGNDFFCYSPAGENPISDAVADYSYLTANGDPTSFLYYKVDGDTVTYKMWEVSDSKSVADGHFETKTVSLSNLEKDYYVTQSQKDEVNSYVSQLRSEADYLNQNQ